MSLAVGGDLQLSQQPVRKHRALVSGLGWGQNHELYTVGDDRVVNKWSLDGKFLGQVMELEEKTYVTSFQWCPTADGSPSALFAAGCSDGKFRIYNKSGRLERAKEAHMGAVTCVAWNSEGSALATGGEDGAIKQWSKTGHMRSQMADNDLSVHAMNWSPDDSCVLFCSGNFITIKPLQGSKKPTKWKAHKATILSVRWNPVSSLIVSGGEDCKYKVWDSYGRNLYTSKVQDYPITSLAWEPSGEYFAFGSFNIVAVCDKTGWVMSRGSCQTGSVVGLDWTDDGNYLAGAGSNGSVTFGAITARRLTWRNFTAVLTDSDKIQVTDVLADANQTPVQYEFGHRVIDMQMSRGYLIICTEENCYVYSMNANHRNATPVIFAIQGVVNLIVQSDTHFMLVTTLRGLQIFSYKGKLMSSPQVPSLRPGLLTRDAISLSSDCLALVDPNNSHQILLIDPQSGSQLDPVEHSLEVTFVSLDCKGNMASRMLVFVDRNRDLFIKQIYSTAVHKLTTMTNSCMWNEDASILAAISDAKLVVWYSPEAQTFDRDLMSLAMTSSDASSFGKMPRFVSFEGSTASVRREDGALLIASILPYPTVLKNYANNLQWDRCSKLCRLIDDPVLWAVLAVCAIQGQELDQAEVALAAIEEVEKMEYMRMIKAIPSAEGRSAELMLYRRQPRRAEQILTQAGLYYRCIMMHIRLFNWKKALTMAVEQKIHVDTVLGYRQNHLRAAKQTERDPDFIRVASDIGTVDWQAIRAKQDLEIEKETKRGGAYAGSDLGMSEPELRALLQ
jgi:intraflagellar transport protein 80